ncbi:hypothetical protein EVAR_82344_1 [Eumeta japonica]|uniref:Uncharacterized protein n=1 Tax=Eumeta variegata TaxID=151549 RepID=A0A4C1UAR1_EUMVA|nr:hypothetical protein EVAR_82344_1 [Eumeta japonica]
MRIPFAPTHDFNYSSIVGFDTSFLLVSVPVFTLDSDSEDGFYFDLGNVLFLNPDPAFDSDPNRALNSDGVPTFDCDPRPALDSGHDLGFDFDPDPAIDLDLGSIDDPKTTFDIVVNNYQLPFLMGLFFY